MSQRKVPYGGSKLKQKLLETRIDRNTNSILSVREWLKRYSEEFQIKLSNVNYYYTIAEVVKSNPYKGRRIDEDLVKQYAIDQGIIKGDITKEELREVKVKLLNEDEVIKKVCEKLEWNYSDVFTAKEIEKSLEFMFGELVVQSTKKNVELEMRNCE